MTNGFNVEIPNLIGKRAEYGGTSFGTIEGCFFHPTNFEIYVIFRKDNGKIIIDRFVSFEMIGSR